MTFLTSSSAASMTCNFMAVNGSINRRISGSPVDAKDRVGILIATRMTHRHRLVGVDMEWKPFFPIFFVEHQAVGDADMSLLSTLGWKEQAKLADDGIGFVQKGYKRFAVWSREAGTGVVV
jgi:hypothetical protein